tara:strand:- start:4515 stop:5240 length:726 start_codon:yes stop_codon:yes gene_type:complete
MGLAVITGGGRGIGAAISRRLAKDGHQILLTYNMDSQSAESVIADLRNDNVDCVATKVDCGNRDEVFILADHPWMKNGVDILVLNHGMYQRSSAKDLTLDELELTMDVNFRGAVAVYTALSPHLTNTAKIIAIGSQLGIKGSPHGAHYAASKGALHAWARSLASNVAKSGQRVNVIAPGAINTDIISSDTKEKRRQRDIEIPMGRVGEPREIASVVSFLTSDDSSYITGAILHVNGGLFLP